MENHPPTQCGFFEVYDVEKKKCLRSGKRILPFILIIAGIVIIAVFVVLGIQNMIASQQYYWYDWWWYDWYWWGPGDEWIWLGLGIGAPILIIIGIAMNMGYRRRYWQPYPSGHPYYGRSWGMRRGWWGYTPYRHPPPPYGSPYPRGPPPF